MLDLNRVRADFATYLVGHAGKRHSLDAALMHVVERAYQQGLADGIESKRDRIERLRGLCKWASGRLLDAGDVEGSETVLDLVGDMEPAP